MILRLALLVLGGRGASLAIDNGGQFAIDLGDAFVGEGNVTVRGTAFYRPLAPDDFSVPADHRATPPTTSIAEFEVTL